MVSEIVPKIQRPKGILTIKWQILAFNLIYGWGLDGWDPMA